MLKKALILVSLGLYNLSFASEKTFKVRMKDLPGCPIKEMSLSEIRTHIAAGNLLLDNTKIKSDQMDEFINYLTTAGETPSTASWTAHQIPFSSLSLDPAKK